MRKKKPEAADCVRPRNGPNSGYFPNVVVLTHENRRTLFYDDLLRGKTVLVHFFSTRDLAASSLAEHLAKVQPYIGSRLGRDVFLYSITTDPHHDTPAVLESFAVKVQAQPGWLFLTGDTRSIELLKSRLFAGAGHAGHGEEDCSLGMLRYGNEAVGLWGSAAVKSSPEWIARRLSWVMSRPMLDSTGFNRRGPAPLQTAVTAEGGR